jgi:peptide/nickel transport system substrate-binding protein
MRGHTKFFITLLILTLLIFGAFGCSQEVPVDGEPVGQEEEIFIVARGTDAVTLDANWAYYEGEIDLIYHMYEGLVAYVDDDLNVGPSLATEWSSDEEGKVWTFKLREGVKFHDGTDFNAGSVVFTYERILQEGHPYADMGDWSYLDYLLGEVIAEVKEIDEYTVEFTLNEVFAPFLTYMGLYSQFIVSPAGVMEHGDEFYKNPVGTGPYMMEEWKSEELTSMVLFEDYWGEKPAIEKIIWKVVPDATTRMMELQTGEVQAIKTILPEQYALLDSDPDVNVVRVSGANIFYGSINHGVEPLDDLRVRQALMHAIDFDSLVDSVYEGLGTRAINPMPPTVFGFNDDIVPYAYDPDRARELLAEAGYPDGFDLDIHSLSTARVYVGRPIDAAEIIADNLRAVGINPTVIVNEAATHFAIISSLDYQLAFEGWYDVAHPNNFLRALILEGTTNNYKPQELWDLANAANGTNDRDLQEQYYREMQEIIHNDVGIMPVAHNDYTVAVTDKVEGFKLDTIGNVILLNTYYK